MLNENVENMKADAKNAVSDIGNIMSHAKADAKADVGNKMVHAKADAEKAKANIENKMADTLK
jgi:hypothetical protein